jgi:CheY-like chemotaxis protein
MEITAKPAALNWPGDSETCRLSLCLISRFAHFPYRGTVILRIAAPSDTKCNRVMDKGGGTDRPRVVLADDHAGMREQISLLLAQEFEVAGSVSEGEALLLAVARLRPDAVISDIHMPLIDGIEAGRRILQQGLCSAILILTVYNEPELVQSALACGIRGYVLKGDAGEELAPAVHTVTRGGRYLSSSVRQSLIPLPPHSAGTL